MRKRYGSNTKKVILTLFVICILFVISWIIVKKLEGEKPAINVSPEFSYIKSTEKINIDFSDKKSGLRSILVELLQGNKKTILYEKKYEGNTFFPEKNIKHDNATIILEPDKLGLVEGKAILQIIVNDFSWRNSLKGNESTVKKEVTVDYHAPVIEVLTNVHNITTGGSGLVIYRLNEVPEESGVIVDGEIYKGYSGYFKNHDDLYLCFFALNYDKQNVDDMHVFAKDRAGNESIQGFYYHIIKKKFKKDTINISDSFLNRKLPEFANSFKFAANTSNIEKYLQVNNEFRKITYNIISALSEKTENKMYWQGAFLRFSGSPMAGYADNRTYLYNGKPVDQQVHLGVDIASVVHAKVPAANNGKIIFAGPAGIYGNAVVIDHGFGLFSLYGHMSNILVKVGQMVSKGDIIGITGMTGLAGGDHLHFSILVNKTYVNPIEWWDNKWIKDNIMSKIEDVSLLLSK
jgi:murein DD-endopeptidase MepM/ murein hydrolase activator NlpD